MPGVAVGVDWFDTAFGLLSRYGLLLCILYSIPVQAWWPFLTSQKPFVIILNAEGNPRNPGRSIDNNFEQTITLTIAQQLKQRIMQEMPTVQVYLNRNEREISESLQTASLANKISADFVLSINCYQEHHIKPSLYIYQFSYGSSDSMTSSNELQFIPFDRAYTKNYKKSELYAHIFQKNLGKTGYTMQFDCKGIYAIPFKPLIGITSPAIAIEIGLKNKDDWKKYIDPLFLALQKVIEQ